MKSTPRCKAAIQYAVKTCASLGHSNISSAHLVLGLLSLSGGVGSNVLRSSGLSVESLQKYLAFRQLPAEETIERDGVIFGRSANEALSRAEEEAAKFNHTFLGVEHLALSLLSEQSGPARDLFASLQVDRDKMRQTIVQEIS